MLISKRSLSWSLPAAFCLQLLVGCGLSKAPVASSFPTSLRLTGSLHGGQQPVAGATIQLYSSNSSALMGASTPLLTTTVSSSATGFFSITGEYTCPSAGALVYAVATGGNPGGSAGGSNPSSAMMTVLGTCGSLNSSTFITINELTTLAAVETLAAYMADYAHVGSASSNELGLSNAFSSALALVNPATGQVAAPPSGVSPSAALLNTLANVLASCINGNGVPGSPCTTLFQNTVLNGVSPTNTIAAALNIVRAPTQNLLTIFNLGAPFAPFQPALTVVPSSFTYAVSLTLPSAYTHITDQLIADRQGHIWLLQPFVGTLTQYDDNLNVLHTLQIGAVGLDGVAQHMTLDPQDDIWVPLPTGLLKISSDGSVLSPAAGYPFATSGVGQFNGFFNSDSSGNIWVFIYRQGDSAICLQEYSNAGVLISPSSGYCGSQVARNSSGTAAERVFADDSGNMYIPFISSGSPLIEKFSPSGAYNDYSTPGFELGIFEPLYHQIWGTNTADVFRLDATGTLLSRSRPPFVASVVTANSVAVDGGGNLWLSSVDGTLEEFDHGGAFQGGCTSDNRCGIPIASGNLAAVAVDSSGNIFVVNAAAPTLSKITGLGGAL